MAEKKVKLTNKTQGVVVAGQIRINPGQTIEVPENKISEGLRRLIGKGVEKSE